MEKKFIFIVGVFSIVYFFVNKCIFDNIFLTSQQIIDEEFHIPQGKLYCSFNFTTWDPKITTLPGLYIISTIFVGLPGFECSTYNLRFVNLIAATLNFILICLIFNLYGNKTLSWKKQILCSINLSILPPMYFFSNLYYTDILSITTVLLILVGTELGAHISTSFACVLSTTVRQTNVVYAIFCGQKMFLEQFVQYGRSIKKKHKRVTYKQEIQLLFSSIASLSRGKYPFYKVPVQVYLKLSAYGAVLIAFGAFVACNGAIVVGDRTAHTVSLHAPQLFYFGAFAAFFLLPFSVQHVRPFVKFVRQHSVVSCAAIASIACVVHLNTIVHPYLLADNRHFVFYIWMRFYERFYLFRYLMSAVYLFALHMILHVCCESKTFAFSSSYLMSCVLVLVFQSMIELRYFLLPFIMLRLQIVRNVQWKSLILEFVFYFVINYQTLRLFFDKNIIWEDYSFPQKLIW